MNRFHNQSERNAADYLVQAPSPGKFVDAGFFVLRTPLLPFDDFVNWGKLSGSEHAYGSDHTSTTRTAWEQGVGWLRQRLCEIVDHPEIRLALYLASPSLETSIDSWKQDPDSKKGLQTERALVRYFCRMTGRSTPFGVFSGCSVGTIGNGTATLQGALRLQSRSQYRVSLRLDFQCISALATALREIPEIAEDLTYRPNSSLHKTGNVWHYLQLQHDQSRASFSLVKLYNDEYLQAVIARAQLGCRIQEFTQTLMELGTGEPITPKEATAYIQELIRSDVLIADLSPALTHENPLSDLISQLDRIPAATRAACMLKSVKKKMSALQKLGLHASPSDYKAIAAELKTTPGMPDLPSVFQVDMIKPRESLVLPNTVVSEFLQSIELLIAMGSNSSDSPRKLNSFRERFQQRYGNSWQRLAEVLDEETGIGVDPDDNGGGSQLIRELGLSRRNERPKLPLREPHATLLRKLLESANQRELLIQASDFPALETIPCAIPDTFGLIGAVVAKSTDAISSGDFKVVLRSAGGPSGASMLGRFCNADPDLNHHVEHYLRREESINPDAIYAEVVHLPHPRTGNILQRPVLRGYEITYLGKSGAAPDHQISVSDLWVTVTPKGEIFLYSERLGKRILPRLTAAHAFNQRSYPSVYRFLSYLQYEQWTYVPVFAWGPLESLPFLPRLTAGKTVLSLARWRITPEEAGKVLAKDRYSAFLAVQELRREKTLPQWMSLIQRDETLPVDLNNPLSVDAFLHVLKRAGEGVLQEMYPLPAELCVSGSEGRFQHEVLIPFLRQEHGAATRQPLIVHPVLRVRHAVARKLPPGSEWVFFKVYAGPATLDELLKTMLPSLVQSVFSMDLASRWFFIRYANPDLHLRLRFQSPNPQLAHEVLRFLEKSFHPLMEANRIWRIEVDTYDREIERYGGVEATLAAEDIFFADSEAVLDILQSLNDEIDSGLRWKLGLLGIDTLLVDCGLQERERMLAAEKARKRYEREFRVEVETKIRLGQRFRKERGNLETLLGRSDNENPVFAKAQAVFKTRSGRIQAAIRNLRELDHRGQLHAPIEQLALSYVHMHVNRLMREEQRAHEFILYDFLCKLYEGVSARQHNFQASESF